MGNRLAYMIIKIGIDASGIRGILKNLKFRWASISRIMYSTSKSNKIGR